MTLPRDLERERYLLDEVLELCTRHPRFMGRELNHAERVGAERFARLYHEYEKEVGSLDGVSRPAYLQMPLEKWKEETPLHRYVAIEMNRAADIHRMHAVLQAMTGVIPDGPRLDMGSRSCFFAGVKNAATARTYWERGVVVPPIEEMQNPWYSADIELQKPLPTDGTIYGRDMTPGFREIGSDGKIPFDIEFQVVSMNMVLHHIDPPIVGNVLSSVFDSLVPGGLLIVLEDLIGMDREIEPARRNYIIGIDEFFYPDALGNQRPMMQWRDEIEKVGFRAKLETTMPGIMRVRNVVGLPVEEGFMVFHKPK